VSLGGILKRLTEGGVRFVVIGGAAATWHGSARITNDVDICYDPTPENRALLAAVLAGLGAYLRAVEPGLPFFMDARTLRDVPVLTLVTGEGDLDVMDRVTGVGEFEAVEAQGVTATIEGVAVRVLGLDALIAAKRATGRRKDQEALLELEALREKRQQMGLD
jgi:predicted nucleotidyltransferase